MLEIIDRVFEGWFIIIAAFAQMFGVKFDA